MMPGDDSLVFKSWVDPEGRGKLVLTEQTWHGSSTSANMCRNKVLFSQGGFFFFLQLGKTQQCTGNKIFRVFFPSPKMQLKHKGYLCVFWTREKKRMKQVHLGRKQGVSSFHSPVQQAGCELVVLRPSCSPALVLSSLSPPSLWDVLSWRGLSGGSGPVL